MRSMLSVGKLPRADQVQGLVDLGGALVAVDGLDLGVEEALDADADTIHADRAQQVELLRRGRLGGELKRGRDRGDVGAHDLREQREEVFELGHREEAGGAAADGEAREASSSWGESAARTCRACRPSAST
jgi:hypothetical protein